MTRRKQSKPSEQPRTRDVSNAPLAPATQTREPEPKYLVPQDELPKLDTRPPEERELPRRPGPFATDLED